MTEHYKIEQKIVEQKRVEWIECDRCGAHVDDRPGREFDLSFSETVSYRPGEGDREGWEVADLCDDCVRLLKKILTANGFKVAEVKDSW